MVVDVVGGHQVQAGIHGQPGQGVVSFGVQRVPGVPYLDHHLSPIHISEPTRRYALSYAVFCLKNKKQDRLNNLQLWVPDQFDMS